MTYFVYILTNYTNNVLYVGVTNNLVRRVYEHKQHFVAGFTSDYHVDKLVYFEQYPDVRDAITREKQLKAGSRKRKFDLILGSNPEFRDLYDEVAG